MTTIVATKDAIYSDSNVVDGTAVFKAVKIFRIRGKLVGCAGDNLMITAFLDQMRKGVKKLRPPKDAPPDEKDFSGLVVDASGIHHYDSSFTEDVVLEPFMAVGTGGDAARGALHAGASPELAVEIACQIDSGSRGPVQTLQLNQGVEGE